jgi:hypothetical protein
VREFALKGGRRRPAISSRRYLRWFTGGIARVDYHALYHLNVATEARRVAFIGRVAKALERL